MKFNEDSRVKIPSIIHLSRLGYKYLSLKNAIWDEKTNIFTDIFKKSILNINKDRLEIIDRGLEAYFSSDFLVAIHILIPQLEEAIRNIIEISGGNVLKQSRGVGY